MSFINKNEPTVLNIKLTSYARRMMSEGKLDFKYISLGDSEIDYNIVRDGIDFSEISILAPVDTPPRQLSYLKDSDDSQELKILYGIPSTESLVKRKASDSGFFTKENDTYSYNPTIFKQVDCRVDMSGTSGDVMKVIQNDNYGANDYEPEVGDYLIVRWGSSQNTTPLLVNDKEPLPVLVYRVMEKISGSISGNNLLLRVDRDVPKYSNSLQKNIGCLFFNYEDVYYDYNPATYLNDSVFAFFENTQYPPIRYMFWNMSLLFTNEIEGVKDIHKKFRSFNTAHTASFVRYIQNHIPELDRLGVIHYSNDSISNDYGEELYKDSPVLVLPTIMWDKSQTSSMGLKIYASDIEKRLNNGDVGLDLHYRDLSDGNGIRIGKLFNTLKMFVIEHPDLIFALSYKGNRSWTLPVPLFHLNSNADCPPCDITFDFEVTNESIDGENDGSVYISNILGGMPQTTYLLSIKGLNHDYYYTEEFNDLSVLVENLPDGLYSCHVYDVNTVINTCEGIEFSILQGVVPEISTTTLTTQYPKPEPVFITSVDDANDDHIYNITIAGEEYYDDYDISLSFNGINYYKPDNMSLNVSGSLLTLDLSNIPEIDNLENGDLLCIRIASKDDLNVRSEYTYHHYAKNRTETNYIPIIWDVKPRATAGNYDVYLNTPGFIGGAGTVIIEYSSDDVNYISTTAGGGNGIRAINNTEITTGYIYFRAYSVDEPNRYGFFRYSTNAVTGGGGGSNIMD